MMRCLFIILLALPVVLLGGLLAFVVFGPKDIPPTITIALAVGIAMMVAYTVKLGRDNR